MHGLRTSIAVAYDVKVIDEASRKRWQVNLSSWVSFTRSSSSL